MIEQSASSVVKDIVNSVIESNTEFFPENEPEWSYDFREISINYGEIFFNIVKNNSSKITYGLLLGLTKKFIEFGLYTTIQNYTQNDKTDTEKIFSSTVNEIAQKAANLVDNDVIVYVIYREIKSALTKSIHRN